MARLLLFKLFKDGLIPAYKVVVAIQVTLCNNRWQWCSVLGFLWNRKDDMTKGELAEPIPTCLWHLPWLPGDDLQHLSVGWLKGRGAPSNKQLVQLFSFLRIRLVHHSLHLIGELLLDWKGLVELNSTKLLASTFL
jgi:hypothetical protein